MNHKLLEHIMPPADLIDLTLDSPLKSAPLKASTKSRAIAGVILLSDDFDSSINLDESLTGAPAKRRKLSTSPLQDDDFEILPRKWKKDANDLSEDHASAPRLMEEVSTSVVFGRSSNDRPIAPRTRSNAFDLKSFDFSDPILFTSSPDGNVASAFPSARRRRLSSNTMDDLEEIEPLRDRTSTHNPPPKLTSHLSDRTTALLAKLGDEPSRDSSRERSASRTTTGTRGKSKAKEAGRERTPVTTKPKHSKSHQTEIGKAVEAEDRKREKARKLQEKEAERERKKREKEQKAREREQAAALAEVNKSRTDKKTSTPEMIVDLPHSLEGTTVCLQIREFLKNLKVESATYSSLPSNVIKWRRKVIAEFNEDMGHWEPVPARISKERHILCLVSAKEFVEMSTSDSIDDNGSQDLESHVQKLKSAHDDCIPIYVIEGLTSWMRKNKTVRNRAFQAAVIDQMDTAGSGAPEDGTDLPANPRAKPRRKKQAPHEYVDEDLIEGALLRLQVMHNCLIYHTAAPIESAEWIANFTQHISTIPYRTQAQTLTTSFCMDVGQVKTGDSAPDTYVKMLQEIVRVTAPIAYGIAADYPDLPSLMRVLETRGQAALEDVRKVANKDGKRTDARIGPALSRRLWRMFLGVDPASNDV
ncbi:MAG: hypothetical protein M1819_001467 [Sarea resinae]|nr:MAG: hypothetical protein M1819_001467 [Sarea resinae]